MRNFIIDVFRDYDIFTYPTRNYAGRPKKQIRLFIDNELSHTAAKDEDSVFNLFIDRLEIEKLDKAVKDKNGIKIRELLADVRPKNVFEINGIADLIQVFKERLYKEHFAAKLTDDKVVNLTKSYNNSLQRAKETGYYW